MEVRSASGIASTALSVGASALPGVYLGSIAGGLGAPPAVSRVALPAAYALGHGLYSRSRAYRQGQESDAPPELRLGDTLSDILIPAVGGTIALGGVDWALNQRPTLPSVARTLGANVLVNTVRKGADYLAQLDGWEDKLMKESMPLRPAAGGPKPMSALRPGNRGGLADQFSGRNRGGISSTRGVGSPLSTRGVRGTLMDTAAQIGGGAPSVTQPAARTRRPAVPAASSQPAATGVSAPGRGIAPAAPAASLAPAPKIPKPKVPAIAAPGARTPTPSSNPLKPPAVPKISEAEDAEEQWAPEGSFEKVGMFIRIPEHIARLYPDRDGDPSPPHITALIVGKVDGRRVSRFMSMCRDAFREVPVFRAEYAEVHEFPTTEEGEIPVVQRMVLSDAFLDARAKLVRLLRREGFTVEDRWVKEYKPHSTLVYRAPAEDYRGLTFKGGFRVEGVEVWGLPGMVVLPLANSYLAGNITSWTDPTRKTSAGPGLVRSLFTGVRRGLTAPIRMFPVPSFLAGSGLSLAAADSLVGEPSAQIARQWRADAPNPFRDRYVNWRRGTDWNDPSSRARDLASPGVSPQG